MTSSTIQTTIDLPKSLPWLINIKPDELGGYIRKSLAVELFREGRISLGKAAEIAGFETKIDMIEELMSRNIGLAYSIEDAEEDLNTLKQILK
ncbi:UPF0175 family protein [Methanospirillum sp. J.3.6.1-F.2.7.3]|jgi:predicted HTH domain antitoxin|uniref:UPF0175 family protein n=2 Tax=Methanospirillum TaxID=2202 RepID=A0A8E7B2S6_9EURY|nr:MULTISPECIES: UPF0175 family protein [Methanospirillum]MDX8549320.1 UPF0175 family protein [Methanospirillum hungatei]QVV89387.1 UPF0175 family protein [Methanospirillum sp. J.3.6.1-F.2.7.3]QXO93381.1 UPF0175 family protein [Methanospirillum hungatei]